jgi:hypothetical protein
MANIIEEYLVKLGFSTDVPGYDKFQKSLNDAGSFVINNSTGMIRAVAQFETAAIAGFAAVGGAVIALADKAAMADQNYRLLALHMYTSVPVARQLKVALDALGAPLEDIMYDPELARRFKELVELQQRVALPEDFEKNMEKVRDVRQAFINLYTFIDKYFMPMISNALVRIFGGDMDNVLKKVQGWTDYLIENMPQIADAFADYLAPILETTKGLFEELYVAAKQFAQLFTNVIGLLTDDKDLQGATTSWKDFGKAVQEVGIFIGGVATDTLKLIGNVMKLVEAFIAADKATDPFISKAERHEAWEHAKSAIRSMDAFGDTTPPLPRAPSGMPHPAPTGLPAQQQIERMIVAQAVAMGVDPKIALAVAQKESSFRQFGKGGEVLTNPEAVGKAHEHAMGVFQLLPSTAKGLGVDPSNMQQNIYGGVKLLADLQKQYGGNIRDALAHYEGRGGAESYQKADAIIEAGLHINTLTINVPSGDPKAVKDATIAALTQTQKLRIQRNQAEFGNQQWNVAGGG